MESVIRSAYMMTWPFALRAARPMVLDEATVVAQEAFLVRVQDGNQAYFRQVKTLAQQVDAHQHVEGALAQLSQYFHTLERPDVRMHIARLDALVEQMVRQIFRHLLRERGNERTLVAFCALARFVDDVVYLAGRGAHDDFRVQKPVGRIICSTFFWLTRSS